jgi:hypothetical protein
MEQVQICRCLTWKAGNLLELIFKVIDTGLPSIMTVYGELVHFKGMKLFDFKYVYLYLD